MNKKELAKLAFRFVIIVGIINLFADFTYEGGRSVNGAFLGSLGASAAVVGFVAGFGELIGYSFRSITGFIADRTHKYWIMIFVGYCINLLAVPALALSGNWPTAALLMIVERTGRAIRKPSMETMLSYAGHQLGNGWVFGLTEALDQLGATMGPLVVALVLFLKGGYRNGYAILLISAFFCLAVLVVARLLFPNPKVLEKKEAKMLQTKGFSKAYWWYVLAGGLIAVGFADFSLIAFHFQQGHVIPQSLIPVLYAAAMMCGAISALVFGKLLDRYGFSILVGAFFISALFAPFVFLGNIFFASVGMILWGLGLGAQDSLLKAVLAGFVSASKRSTGFGVFDTGFGICWFLGSFAMGLLYGKSIVAVIIFSVLFQLLALPAFLIASKNKE